MNQTRPAQTLQTIGKGLGRLILALLVLGGAFRVQAQEVISINTETETADVFVVVWDPVNKASYVKVLGMTMNEFIWQGQQDAGVQKFWTLNVATDINFQRLRSLGGSLSDLRWAVLSFDNEGFFSEDTRAMTTLQPTATPGVEGLAYRNMTSMNIGTMLQNVGSFAVPFAQGNNVKDIGSSFRVNGQDGYFSGEDAFRYHLFGVTGNPFPITNPIGSSSWFYYLTIPVGPLGPSSAPFSDPVVVDEFDNLSFDGYWGMAANPADNTFLLSYTLPQAATALNLRIREFAASIGRTESTGGFAVRRLEGGVALALESPAGGSVLRLGEAGLDLSGGLSVSPVPEPGTWALMLLGLAGVAAFARRRRA